MIQSILYLPYIVIVIELMLCIKSFYYAFLFIIAMRVVLPANIRIGPVSMNTACCLILFTLWLVFHKSNNTRRDEDPLFPLKYLILPLCVTCAFTYEVPYITQYADMCKMVATEILPFILFVLLIDNTDKHENFIKILFSSYVVVGVYGIITWLLGFNPLFDLFSLVFGYTDEMGDMLADEVRGSFSGQASGNFSTGIPWGQTSLLMFSLSICCSSTKEKKLRYLVIILSMVNCFLSGKRSSIMPMILIALYYSIIHVKANKKFFFRYLLIALSVFSLSMFNRNVRLFWDTNVMTSILFWDDDYMKKQDIKGSSKEMRNDQFDEATKIASKYPLFGYGNNYYIYYGDKHPKMLGFESFYFSTLISFGYIGVIIWGFFFEKCRRYTKQGAIKRTGVLFHLPFWISILFTNMTATLYLYLIITGVLSKSKYNNRFQKYLIRKIYENPSH